MPQHIHTIEKDLPPKYIFFKEVLASRSFLETLGRKNVEEIGFFVR